jgi:uncharacterized membrane protein YeaQ/YmgE (transglycosylase-associated protein family)
MITYLILLLISGLVIGALGRLAIPGPDPMGIGATILVGIGGSLIGGLVGYALLGRPTGMLLSVLGAALIVYVIRRVRGGSFDDPYGRPRRRLFGR